MTQPIISLIAAMAHDRVIGVGNTLPWNLPQEMKHFRQVTRGKPVIAGRKTFESIGRPLPDRKNIIITRDQNYEFSGCLVVHSLPAALAACQEAPEIMIIGGADIYRQALPMAHRLYLTFIDLTIAGDAFFPEWDATQWQEVSRQHVPASAEGEPSFDLVQYDRLT